MLFAVWRFFAKKFGGEFVGVKKIANFAGERQKLYFVAKTHLTFITEHTENT